MREIGRLAAVGANTDPTILPAPYGDWILGDTYVLDGFQYLFLYHRPSEKFVPLAKLKSTAAHRGIHRVDLHARTRRDEYATQRNEERKGFFLCALRSLVLSSLTESARSFGQDSHNCFPTYTF